MKSIKRTATHTTHQATECEPKIIKKRNGEKIVTLPGFKGITFITDEQFLWLVDQAKEGAFDSVIGELFKSKT